MPPARSQSPLGRPSAQPEPDRNPRQRRRGKPKLRLPSSASTESKILRCEWRAFSRGPPRLGSRAIFRVIGSHWPALLDGYSSPQVPASSAGSRLSIVLDSYTKFRQAGACPYSIPQRCWIGRGCWEGILIPPNSQRPRQSQSSAKTFHWSFGSMLSFGRISRRTRIALLRMA